MSLSLRSYQTDLDAKIHAATAANLCVVSPCGSGKTNVFCHFAGQIPGRVWILVHRVVISRQTSKTLNLWSVPHGRIAPGQAYDGQRVQVCSVDTLATRIKSGAEPMDAPDVLIVDECDLCESPTWQRVLKHYPNARKLGFTGSPERLDGKGLANSYDALIEGPSVEWLMSNGFLARPEYYGIPHAPDLSKLPKHGGDYSRQALDDLGSVLTGDVLDTYRKHAAGTKFLGFCVSVKHAETLAAQFNEAGYPCAAIHAGSPDRAEKVEQLASGTLLGLFQVDLFGRGTDLPIVETGLDARPTQSLARFIQAVGRILRPHPGKHARWFDFAGNLDRHGLAETPRSWSLAGVTKRKRAEEILQAVRQCQTCHGWSAPAPCCPQCGAVLPLKPRVTKEQAGHLRKLTPEEVEAAMTAKKAAVAERKACRTFGELVALARKTGKNLYWATKVWRGRQR